MSNQTSIQKVEFRFREKDGYKRPTVEVDTPLPTAEYLVEILGREDSDKTKVAVVDAAQAIVINHLRGIVSGDENFSQDTLDALVEKGTLALETIANLAPSGRNVISNADLAAFAKVFVEVAEEVLDTDRRIASVAGATVAAEAFVDRVRAAAGKNDVLDKLRAMLDKFTEAASEEVVGEHASVIEWLYVKLEEAKKKEEISLDNLD